MVDCAATWPTTRTLLCEKRFLGKLQLWHNQAQLWQRVAATSWSHTSRAKRCRHTWLHWTCCQRVPLSYAPKAANWTMVMLLQWVMWSCSKKMSLYLSGVGSWNACSILAHCLGLSLNTHWWTICWIRTQSNMTAQTCRRHWCLSWR